MADSFYVEVVAPDRSVFKGEALRFRAPGVTGSFEVLRNHAPLVAATGIGPVYITLPSDDRFVLATSGGFVEVLNNRVIMIVEAAEPASEIDVERARAAEERARERLENSSNSSALDREAWERALARARNRLRVAMGTVGKK
ncbi:MAG TPA: ATP synthase F1 subunit epsilon [Rhodothermales bacterium]|nr:ATP synthase F1 subunit epsilon [Rhodothermales bacterium]